MHSIVVARGNPDFDGAKKVDLNALPPELANDPKLMSELQGRGMLDGGGVSKVQATPKGSEKVTIGMINFHSLISLHDIFRCHLHCV